MKVWVIRLSMIGTLAAVAARRFFENALSAGGSQPRHSPARRNPQGRAVASEAGAVARGRFTDDPSKGVAERAEAAETDIEANLRHRTIGFAQQLHRPLHPSALKVPMRGLAERGPELAAEVSRRDVSDACERRYIERLGERPVHRVSGPQHPAVAILG